MIFITEVLPRHSVGKLSVLAGQIVETLSAPRSGLKIADSIGDRCTYPEGVFALEFRLAEKVTLALTVIKNLDCK